ncbi:distal tail protein Dit [Mechercharimyces sp. CAU 1602]|uniref:distal tail protein Dit n=1 Tax=Mechercharimyces sp. CAU 1602 TaxID=2973933 RepID=UPI00216183CB|nr:distal tail protein Dit [Mechercharimyces sp. CAU 1602]MCS1350326.1 phage tail family protein [Mechercharimyces sp. CAU 1602]
MSFTFNGVHSDEHNLTVTKTDSQVLPPRQLQTIEVPARAGTLYYGAEKGARIFTLHCALIGETDFEHRIRLIAEWLDVDEPAPLVFNTEADKTYYAVVNDTPTLDRVGTYGEFSIQFYCADPHAFGEVKTQPIANPDAVFVRQGIRYREDGTEVTENYPVYKDGKFGKAVLIEEGTENLLTTASLPSNEEVAVDVGEEYSLSIVDGSAKIEHTEVYEINATLEKEGVDFEGYVDQGWQSGTHVNTVEADNDYLELAKTGEDLRLINGTDSEWADSSNTLVDTTSENGNLVLSNLPSWDVEEKMEDYTDTWQIAGQGYGGTVTQKTNYVEIIDGGSGVSGNFGMELLDQTVFPVTMDFRVRCRDNTDAYVVIEDDIDYIKVKLPSTSGEWVWHRIICHSSSSMTKYVDGVEVSGGWWKGDSKVNQIQFYIDGPDGYGDFDIGPTYIAFGEDLGAPPSNHEYEGKWTTDYISVSSVDTYESVGVGWGASYPAPFSADDYTITWESQLKIGGAEQGWKDFDKDNIVGLSKGDDVSNVEVCFRITLKSRDSCFSPRIYRAEYTLYSGYETAGYRESAPIDISQVGKASRTELTWFVSDEPTGTSAKVETQVSLDGGSSWSEYTEVVISSDPIPDISQDTDLSNAYLRYKWTLTTTDISETPSIDRMDYDLFTGYKPSQTIDIETVDVGSIGEVESSFIEWSEDVQPNTNIKIETSIDGTNYKEATIGSSFLVPNENLSGKSLYLRYTIETSDTAVAPTLNNIAWKIAQQEETRISPATSTLSLTPANVSRWQLEKKPFPTGWQAYGSPRNGECIYVKTDEVLNETEGTIEFWVYEEGDSPVQRYMIDLNGNSRMSLYRSTDGNYVIYFNGEEVMSSSAPSIGWHAITIRWNGTEVTLFVDGIEMDSEVLTQSVSFYEATRLYVGCDQHGANQWNSLIDDMRISNIARADEEIAIGYNSGESFEVDDFTTYKVTFDSALASATDSSMIVEGTAPVQPIFTVSIVKSASYLKVSDGIHYVYVTPEVGEEFVVGDVIVIDNERAKVTHNGTLNMPDLDSDFFTIPKGETEFIVEPSGVARIEASFTERWK